MGYQYAIGRPQLMHRVDTPEAYRNHALANIVDEWRRGGAPGKMPGLRDVAERPPAYVSDGRWVCDCDCGNGVAVAPEWTLGVCCSCGAVYRPIVPTNWQAVEIELLRAPKERHRHYFPDAKLAARYHLPRAHRLADLVGKWWHESWTAPRTWVALEVPTAANFNTHVRDNLLEAGVAKVTTAGDIVQATAANALARLAIGTAGQVPMVNAGATALAYADPRPNVKDLWGALTAVTSSTFATVATWTFTANVASTAIVFFEVRLRAYTNLTAQAEIRLQVGGASVTLNAHGHKNNGTTTNLLLRQPLNSAFAAVTVLDTSANSGGDEQFALYTGVAAATIAAGSNTLVWQGRNIGNVADADITIYSMVVVGRTS